MSADGRIGDLPLLSSHSNKLTTIQWHRQRRTCGSFGIHVGGQKTAMKPNTGGCSKKAILHIDGKNILNILLNMVLATNWKLALFPVDLHETGPWSYHQIICQGTQKEPHLPVPWVTGLPTSILSLNPEVVHDLAPVLPSHGLGVVLTMQEYIRRNILLYPQRQVYQFQSDRILKHLWLSCSPIQPSKSRLWFF